MALTSGFFNSINSDRMYNAEDFNNIFTGVINDGIFQSIGTSMMVTAGSGMTVNIGIGKAWFDSTWSINSSVTPITLDDAEMILNRIDTIVLEIDKRDSVRLNSYNIVKGTPASTPLAPTLINDENHKQYPLAEIYVAAGSTEITQAEITNKVGSDATPFITGILETISAEALVTQWEAQFDAWMAELEATDEAWFAENRTLFETWRTEFVAAAEAWETQFQDDSEDWSDEQQAAFEAWVESIRNILDDTTAGNLQNEIDALGTRVTATEEAIDEFGQVNTPVVLPNIEAYMADKETYDAMDSLIVIQNAGIANSAANVTYDNATSGLSSMTVQGAIDEVHSDLSDDIDQMRSDLSSMLGNNYVDDFIVATSHAIRCVFIHVYNSNAANQKQLYTFMLPKREIDRLDATQLLLNGGFGSITHEHYATAGAFIQIGVTSTSCTLNAYDVTGLDCRSTASIYYTWI